MRACQIGADGAMVIGGLIDGRNHHRAGIVHLVAALGSAIAPALGANGYSGSVQALFRLSVKALLRLCSGSIKALFRLY